MIYNIFYDSNKNIAWSCTAGVTDAIKTEQKSAHNYDFLQYDCDTVPNGEDWYINSDGDAVVEKTSFSPSYSTTSPSLDDVVTVTGVPAGTEVFLDRTSAGTMSDTTLTFTAQQAGSFEIGLKKDKYKDYYYTLTVSRYT
tara:strand:+ start:4898 stop:5317 length:420 start_codon:yes stop_codon:yes gene_type:complete